MNVTVVSNVVCENCVSNHRSFECQDGGPYEANSSEQVNYVANNQRQYNPNLIRAQLVYVLLIGVQLTSVP